MERKEICFDARMLWHGGIGMYIRNLLPGLESFFQMKVIVHPKMVESEKWLQKYSLILSTASIYSIQEQMEFFLRIPKTDLFFSPHYNVPLLPVKADKKVVMVHDVLHLVFSHFRWYEKLYARFVMHRALSQSDLVFTNSEFSSNEISKYTKNKIYPIHCGIDPQLFFRETDRNRFVLPSKYVLFVGNLKPHKNLSTLLLAMNQVSKEIQLVVVGKSQEIKPIDRVLCLSSVTNEEMRILYSFAEVLVFPSFYEGFGLPPLEAMSCGCPVIASNVASIPEVCGSAVKYISPGDVSGMAEAIEEVVSNREFKQELIRKGYENVKKFSCERFVARHVELLAQLFS
jgi:glycosyltransferase involved in cell wall biosynthesis